jgi:hypothetical protein
MSEQAFSGAAEASHQELRLAKVARGQRFVIYGILLNLAALVLTAAVGEVAKLVYVPAFVVSAVGLHGLASGLGYAVWKEVLLFVLLLVPLVNLIMLVTVNSKATKMLRAGGYKVGFFGASRRL